MVGGKGVVVNEDDGVRDTAGVEGDADVHVEEAVEGGIVVEGEDGLGVLETTTIAGEVRSEEGRRGQV